jgi:hypothetical protein
MSEAGEGMKPKDAVELSKDALAILQHRMLNEPEDIPSGALLRYMEKVAMLELARLQNEKPAEEKKELTARDVLEMDGLPDARKLELLRQARERAAAELEWVGTAIERLEAKWQESQSPSTSSGTT